MDLLALADFNLVARHGGFGQAARASGRPKATLSRRVAELETSLEVRLLERGPRTLRLTPEGQALYERTRVLFAELEETAAAVAARAATPRGKLRISAPLLFAQIAMGKLAAEFALKHPKVRLEVTTEDRSVDMIEEGYDLVIRANPHPDESLVGRIFLRDRLVLVASPSLTPPIDGSAVPAIVRGSGFLGNQPAAHDPEESTAVWDFKTSAGTTRITVNPTLRLTSLIMVRDAARLGVGVARLPISLVGHDIERGSLVNWGDLDVPEITLWALYPSRRLLSTRVSAFFDHLKKSFPTGAPSELAAYVAR